MATKRIDLRLEETTKARAEEAAALKGMKSLQEYIVRLIEIDTDRVMLDQQPLKLGEPITLPDDVFDAFVIACENPKPPNANMREMIARAKSRGVR